MTRLVSQALFAPSMTPPQVQGVLSSGMEYVHELNPQAVIRAFGQELNPESYSICKADMLIKGQDVTNIKL